jgi:pimeloyl-ACP methyl ester carboxylesterase
VRVSFRSRGAHAHTALALAATVWACGSSDPSGPATQTLDGEWVQVAYGTGAVVRVAVVRPPGYSAAGSHPVILALPWGSGSPDLVLGMIDAYWDDEALSRDFLVVSPAILGSSLETEATEFLPALFDWMDANLAYDPDRVVLVGASNGGRGVFHMLAAEPERFRALIGMPGSYAGPAGALSGFAPNPAWLLVGEDDGPWVTRSQDTRLLLESQGIPTRLDIVPGQGHVLLLDQRELMDWVEDALR